MNSDNRQAHYRRLADEFIKDPEPFPLESFNGRGIVICAGGEQYFTCAWICINRLRRVGCTLPIEVWHLGCSEWNAEMTALLEPFNVICKNASDYLKDFPAANLSGWELKPYAILHSGFKEVLYLDADNFPLVDPEFLFSTAPYLETGSLFWQDRYTGRDSGEPAWLKSETWQVLGIPFRDEAEFETGQLVVDKEECWHPLLFCMHINEHSDYYYYYFYGDKDTFHLAWRKLGIEYGLVPYPNNSVEIDALIIQHDLDGQPLFQHRNGDKWSIRYQNQRIAGFRFEEECFNDLATLKNIWRGFERKLPDDYTEPERKAFREIVSTKTYECFYDDKASWSIELMHDFIVSEPPSQDKNWSLSVNGDDQAVLKLKYKWSRGAGCQLWSRGNGEWSGWWNTQQRERVVLKPKLPPVELSEVRHYQRLEADRLENIPNYPKEKFNGKGLVLAAGGNKYFPCVWVCLNVLRKLLGCRLPIELWYLGAREMNEHMKQLLEPFDVACIDALEVRKEVPCKNLSGSELKPYSIINSRFEEVIFLDVDNVALRDPAFLFEIPQYRESGAIFWQDFGRLGAFQPIWDICGVPYEDEPEFETGQMVLHKGKTWRALQLCMFYNEHSDFYYRYVNGDKETFHFAWKKLNQPFHMPDYPISPLEKTMRQYDFNGNLLFQHRNLDKWSITSVNKQIAGFVYEKECFEFLNELSQVWQGIEE